MPKQTGAHNRRRSKVRRPFKIAVFSCFFVLFLVSTFMVLKNTLEYNKAESSYFELQKLIRQKEYVDMTELDEKEAALSTVSETESGTDKEEERENIQKTKSATPQQRISMDFSALKEINPDIIGWIRVEGTNIDYPIAQTDNNEYYLNHLFNKELNNSGTIFADYRNADDFSDRNTVLYGHHMKNETMFYALEEYKDQEFYDVNPSMTLLTPNGDFTIELVSGTMEDGSYQFVEFTFDSEEAFNSYIDRFRSRSTFASDVEIQPGDKIVSLCTCSYEWANARYMVIGRLVPIMEEIN